MTTSISSPALGSIENATIDEVVERGYLSATIDGICARADITPGQFLHRFSDLEDAYCKVVEVFRDMIVERLFATFTPDLPWRRQMRAAARAMFDFLEEDSPRRGRFLYVEVFNAGERAQLLREEGVQLMAQLIDQGRTHLEEPSLLTPATAEGIAGTLFQQIREAHEADGDGLILISEFMYLVVAPYLGVDAALEEFEAVDSREQSSAR